MKRVNWTIVGLLIAIIPFFGKAIKFILRNVIMAIGNLIISFK